VTDGSHPGPRPGPRVVAVVTDLMDRSRLQAAVPGITFTLVDGADVVVCDLAQGVEPVRRVRREQPRARIVCFGAHVDTDAMDEARAAGADAVLARSRFFRDPAAALHDDA